MNSIIRLFRTPKIEGTVSELPSSKSISNRVLVIKALEGNQSIVSNLSAARDTALMTSLIGSPSKTIDVMDAGTTMRFLTAYFSITQQNKILTGTARMKERPLGLLVNALRQLGVAIDYLEKEGFPPIEIKSFNQQLSSELEIPGDVSSQYISALMMIAPRLPKGLIIRLKGQISSVPYIMMTAALMQQFGAKLEIDLNKQVIKIEPGHYQPHQLTVEADWSAASYWYSFTALAQEASIHLPHVSENSLQGDKAIIPIMDHLGVKSYFKNGSLELSKKPTASFLEWDFRDCPDLAQTVLPLCAAKGYSGRYTGLESLRIKETDRIAALQQEMAKIGSELVEESKGVWVQRPITFKGHPVRIATYHDHRMAMGFAPLSTMINLEIEAPEVVNKSYPGFWKDVNTIGVQTELLS